MKQITLSKKIITKDWGKRCPDFNALCCVCQIWRAWDVIEDLYNDSEELRNFRKRVEHI